MSSVEYLRKFVNERLTAAAEEIFRVFNKTIFEYEEEIDRQRKLLDIVWKPEIKLHRIELPQQHVCKEEEVLADQQLCIQERNSSLDQEDPEPLQIKEEQEEVCISQEEEQLELKQETETFMLTPTDEESDHSEDQTLDFNPDKSQSAAETELPASMYISWLKDESDWENPEVSEPNSDHQLLSHNSHVAEGQDQKGGFMLTSTDEERNHEDQTKDLNADKTLETESVVNMPVISTVVSEAHSEKLLSQKGGKNGDSGSTSNAEPKLKKIHHKSNSHTNNVNNFTMSTIHCNTSMDKKLFLCDTCGKAFKHKPSLDRHMRTHTGEKPYSCNTFGEKLKKGHHKMKRPSNDVNNFTMLKIHRTTPTGLEKKSLKCDVCGKGFKYNSKLQRHLLIHTDEKPQSCKTCGKEFRCSSHLTGHMRTHTGEKPYLCKSCGKRFGDVSSLNRHMRIHTGKKPHTCKICGKNFRRNSYLLVHMRRAHTGEKPYLCKPCGKDFSCNSDLLRHMRRAHTGENPYSCSTCGKKYSSTHVLKTHIRIHTGEKPYSCNTCGKRFTQKSALNVHIRIHSGEKPFTCKTCGKDFSRNSDVLLHVRRVHNGEKPYLFVRSVGKDGLMHINWQGM